jgi:hypothetical protein
MTKSFASVYKLTWERGMTKKIKTISTVFWATAQCGKKARKLLVFSLCVFERFTFYWSPATVSLKWNPFTKPSSFNPGVKKK